MALTGGDDIAALRAKLERYRLAASAATDPVAHKLLLDLITETERLIAEAGTKDQK